MENKTFTVEKRTDLSKIKRNQLRSEGKIPGVVYGLDKDPVTISVNGKEYLGLLNNPFGKNVVLNLEIKDDKKVEKDYVVTYNITKDSISQQILSLDFLRIKDDKKVKVTIPLKFIGVAPGTKLGGTLIKKMDVLTVYALPQNIPTHFDVDLSSLDVGDFLKASDVCDDSYTLVTTSTNVVVRVEAPRKAIETETAEGADTSADAAESSSTE